MRSIGPIVAVSFAALVAGSLAASALSPYETDLDGDGIPDYRDLCPAIADPAQLDSDGDHVGDLCDCAPLAPGVATAPAPIDASLRWIGHETIAWERNGSAPLFNLYRGTIGAGGFVFNETCFAAQSLDTTVADAALPNSGTAFYYLASAANRCGESLLQTSPPHAAASGCALVPRDSDLDGIDDAEDDCPSAANSNQLDSDHDQRGDLCDLCPFDDANDADRDGLCATTRGPERAWLDTTVYVLIPSKFDDGDPTNDYMKQQFGLPNPSYSGGYLGGDYQGAINRLGYLRSLGLNTILTYPPFANDQLPLVNFLASGYRVSDWQAIDRNLGSRALFKQFVDALHGGSPPLSLIVDLPIAMSGLENAWNSCQLCYPNYFRPWGTENIGSAPQNTAYGPVDNSFGMPINNHLLGAATHDAVYAALTDQVLIWNYREYGFDGWRHDSAQNFDTRFFSRGMNDVRRALWRERPDFREFGEHSWFGNPYSWQLPPQEFVNLNSGSGIKLDGIYDFAMIGDLKNCFARGQSPNLLVFNHDAKIGVYDDPRALSASVDNYEADSFLSNVTDGHGKERLKLALAFLFSIDRIPFVYSGNEYAIDYTLPGTLFQSGRDAAFFDWFKQLGPMRAAHPSLRLGSVKWLTRNVNYLSYGRVGGGETIIAAFNISATNNRSETLNIGSAGINCSSVSNLFDATDNRNQLIGSGATQTLKVTHKPWEPKWLLCNP